MPVSRLQSDSRRSLEASEIMGAGTPVVLRSGPRPRLAEEAVLLMGGDKGMELGGILMGATGPEPETRDQRDGEQSPGRRDEQDLRPSGLMGI
jgi:hypothetical protein